MSICLGRCEVRTGSLCGAAPSAEEIKFVGGIEAGVVEGPVKFNVLNRAGVGRVSQAAGSRHAKIERRPEASAATRQRGAGLTHAGAGGFDIRVRSESLFYQPHQRRILERLPPVRE